MGILQTRDQVVKSLDKHLSELHSLRRALSESEQVAIVATPAPSLPEVKTPSGRLTTLPKMPELPMAPSDTIHHAPQPREQRPDPVMTQVIWPGVQGAAVPAPKPLPPPTAVLNALQGLQDVLLQKGPLTPPPMPMSAVFPDHLPDLPAPVVAAAVMPPAAPAIPAHHTPLPPPAAPSYSPPAPALPPQIAREAQSDPRFEHATLEELNSALALAFSQGSGQAPQQQATAEIMAAPHMQSRLLVQPHTNAQWQLPPRH